MNCTITSDHCIKSSLWFNQIFLASQWKQAQRVVCRSPVRHHVGEQGYQSLLLLEVHVPAGFSSNSNTFGPANQGIWVCLKTTGQYVGAEFEVSTSSTEQRCPILFLEVHCPLKFSSNWSNSFKPANQGLLVYLKSTGQCVGAELLSSMIGTEYSCHRTGVSSHAPGGPLSCKV